LVIKKIKLYKMNRSYSKIRHIKNLNESIEKNYINNKKFLIETPTGGTESEMVTGGTESEMVTGGTPTNEQIVESIIRKIVNETKDESMVQKLMRKLKGVSDKQLKYNVENDLPWDWKGSKEGYYEKMENKRHHSGSN
jgi:hypothetical protein